MHGGPYEIAGPTLAATNGKVHGQMLELFGEIFQGNYRVPLDPVSTYLAGED
jgi:hypothetical protein